MTKYQSPYFLFGGSSPDGRGEAMYGGMTEDKIVAIKWLDKIKRDRCWFGHVTVFTESKELRITNPDDIPNPAPKFGDIVKVRLNSLIHNDMAFFDECSLKIGKEYLAKYLESPCYGPAYEINEGLTIGILVRVT